MLTPAKQFLACAVTQSWRSKKKLFDNHLLDKIKKLRCYRRLIKMTLLWFLIRIPKLRAGIRARIRAGIRAWIRARTQAVLVRMNFLCHFEHDMSGDLVSLFVLPLLSRHRSCGVTRRKCFILECCFCMCVATYITHKRKSEKFEHLNL